MSQREAEGRARLLNFAAQLITVTLEDSGTLAERMSKSFPWMLALSPTDRATCAQELIDAARASFATDQPHLAIAELTSGKETAVAIAAGLRSVGVTWLEESDVVKCASVTSNKRAPVPRPLDDLFTAFKASGRRGGSTLILPPRKCSW